jgi:hypothetical protein
MSVSLGATAFRKWALSLVGVGERQGVVQTKIGKSKVLTGCETVLRKFPRAAFHMLGEASRCRCAARWIRAKCNSSWKTLSR